MPRFTISILTHSQLTLAKRCIESVLKHSDDFELILTANGNPEAATYFSDLAQTLQNVRVVVNEKNEGFIDPGRRAIDMVNGSEFFVMLNDDMTVVPGWLDRLAAPFAQFPNAALTGPDKNCCHLLANFHGTAGPFEYLEGSCLCCKVSVLRKLGLFPSPLTGAYGEDSCLSLRVREAGYSIHRVELSMPHVRGATSSMVPQARGWQEANHTWLKKRFQHYLKVRYFEYPIVLRRNAALGDGLLLTPIIRALRQQRPLSPVMVDTQCPDIFRDNPHVAKCERGLKVPPDALVIDLNMAYENMSETHIVEAYERHVCAALGGEFEVKDRSLDFYLRQSDATKYTYSPGAKVVTVHAGPVNWRSKEWGAEKFQVVTKELLASGWTVLLVGPGKTAPISCTADLRGMTTIHQLAAVIGAANLFIGLDSLPLHLAQAMGTPAIGIFGVTSPEFILTAKGAIGVHSKAPSAGLRHRMTGLCEVDDGGEAMRAVSPEAVLEAVVAITQ